MIFLSTLATAEASAPHTPIVINAPIANGVFDRWGYSHPSVHHTPWGGDWATDFYGYPGSPVRLDIREYSAGATAGTPYGVVLSNGSSCASPYDWAGTAYQIALYDGAGSSVGWVLYAHVDTSGVGLYPVGSVLGANTLLGYTAQYPWSYCYQVSTSAGVHTHVEAYNDHDYACYVPRPSGSVVAGGRALGGVGSNNTGPGQSCW